MKKIKEPRSLRSRLMVIIIFCWLLPILIVVSIAGFLLNSNYERSTRQELESDIDHALQQIVLRMDAVFEASKKVSYDGVVRNSYRLYQQEGDSAALYRVVTDYLNQSFIRDARIPAAFISFWEDTDVRPYVSNRGDFGFQAQRYYREQVETDLLEKMKDIDTAILLLEYDGDLYVARNLLDSHFHAYATVVLLCDKEVLFQSLAPMAGHNRVTLRMDHRLVLTENGDLLSVPETQLPAPAEICREAELAGHVFHIDAEIAPFHFWQDIPQIHLAVVSVAFLVVPLLLAIIWLFRRYISNPVETLVNANARLQAGERGYVITDRPDSEEFSTLYMHFNTMSAELKNQFEQSYQEQQALQQAKIKALQSQINPHFLNNTLEVINWEARIAGNDRVSAMIEALSTMLDAALDRDGRSQIAFREELSYVDAYLYIIKERLGERLEVTREINAAMLEELVPRLILQPIVENAVEHDLVPRHGGSLCLRAYREKDRITLEVEHDGFLSDEDRNAIENMRTDEAADNRISGKVGLRNVHQRLALLYGASGELTMIQKTPERVLAVVRFPAAN